MSSNVQTIAYSHTGYFTDIVNCYLQRDPRLDPFYQFTPDWQGLEKAMTERKSFPVDRQLLTEVLNEQYQTCTPINAVQQNIAKLSQEHTFTVTTAHQPNLLTGPLYFIYKCLHTIQLAAALQERFPAQAFVPVYYMGSELRHCWISLRKSRDKRGLKKWGRSLPSFGAIVLPKERPLQRLCLN